MNNLQGQPAVDPLITHILARRILPPVSVYVPEDAVAVARALLAAALDVMEITFRHPQAPECVAAIRRQVPEMAIGAGTLLTEEQLDQAQQAGAQFGVSPGFNPAVVRAAHARHMLFIPGVATPGELEQALALGCRLVKLFPAEALGGLRFIKVIAGPYQHTGVKLVPMGGISRENFASYLAQPLVGAVGCSWMIPPEQLAAKNWTAITESVREVMRLVVETLNC